MRLWVLGALLLVALTACGGGSGAQGPLAEGKTVYADVCSVCHGPSGEGGVGPALDQVAVTWPACEKHIEWISLGSDGWRAAYGDTYGATDRPVEGGMPAQLGSLLESQMAAAAVFERVTYGGVEEAAALKDCGLSSSTEGD